MRYRMTFLFGLMSCAILFQGCATLFVGGLGESPTVIDPGNEETEVIVGPESLGKGKVKKDLSEGVGSGTKQVILKRKGYKSEHHVVVNEPSSTIKDVAYILDLFIPMGLGAALFSGQDQALTGVGIGTALGFGIYLGDRSNLYGQGYPERLELPPPENQNPRGDDLKKEAFVGDINFSLEDEGYRTTIYKNEKQLEKNAPMRDISISGDEAYGSMPNLTVADTLNKTLDSLNFLDIDSIGEEITLNYYNTLKLVPSVKRIRAVQVSKEGYSYAELKVNWKAVNNFGDTVLSRDLQTTSGKFAFGPTPSIYSTLEQKGNRQAVGDKYQQKLKDRLQDVYSMLLFDGVVNTFYDFLKDDELEEIFRKDTRKEAKKKREGWDPVVIKEKAVENKDGMGDEGQSVVTLKKEEGHGSGCILSADGYIVTNNHVVQGQDTVTTIFDGDEKGKAEVIRRSKVADLALLKMDTTDLRPLQVPEGKDGTGIGKKVFAIGTPENIQLGQTVSKGIISGKRNFNELQYYQTDVSINPGNSGGALVNEQGNLVGITNAKMEGSDVEGIGFAIPVRNVEKYLKLDLQ